MIILARTDQDKGSQLEHLTRRLLENLGYQNLLMNLRGAGGEEIDVTATHVAPGLAGTHTTHLICECKAHSRPCDMNDWLKFLGKVYAEEVRERGPVVAYFIALSGVNGNVAGHYEDLHRLRDNVILMSGEQLNVEVSKLLKLLPLESVQQKVAQSTEHVMTGIEPAYFEGKAYWIVFFEDDSFAVLTHNGQECSDSRRATLVPLIQAGSPGHRCVDLVAEALARERAIQAQKAIIGRLMTMNGRASKEALEVSLWNVDPEDSARALSLLLARGWVGRSSDGNNVELAPSNDGLNYHVLAEVYSFLVQGQTANDLFCDVAGCSFYDAHIDVRLLAEVSRTQGGMPIHSEDTEMVLNLMRWSPQALLRALVPDPMLVQKSVQVPREEMEPEMLILERRYFIRALFRCLVQDFRKTAMHDYFYRVRNIVEVDCSEEVRIKGKQSLLLKGDLRERTGICVGDKSLGGGYIAILLRDDMHEPWDSQWPQAPARKGA